MVFKNKDVKMHAKAVAYVAVVISILFYGSEIWAITVASRRELRAFHNRCVRCMCGISMWRVKQESTTTAAVLELAGLRELDVYVARRRIRWLGHVARTEWIRVPRKPHNKLTD